ncbi:MAG: hypothetical protein BJ554DRAFT_3487 [Olpidium bornovanus]|uniref:NodB homology domain-containing protein n=1 Tax=Olpidium bornovanus TaxID=278681 RepID=A0A8H8DFW5_9FUNG|nr:MAG: hypothetical protein BJ554DRAFT_3487 [Olpidium bornovanus]
MELTGVRPKFMRPPYGNMDQRVKFILDKMGYVPVHWNQDTNDWKYTADAVAEASRSVIRSVQEHINENFAARLGTISLQHDVAKIPASLAGPVLDQIGHAGWKVVPVTKCLNSTSWYVADEAAGASARGGSAAKAVAQAGGNSSSSNAAAAAAAVAVASGNSSGPAAAKSAPAAPITAGPAESGAGRVAAVYASSAAVVGSAVAVAVAL